MTQEEERAIVAKARLVAWCMLGACAVVFGAAVWALVWALVGG